MRQSHLGVCSQGEFRFRLLSLARCDVVISRAKIRVRGSDSSCTQIRKDEPYSVGDIVPKFDPGENASQFLSGVITMCTTLDERACRSEGSILLSAAIYPATDAVNFLLVSKRSEIRDVKTAVIDLDLTGREGLSCIRNGERF